MGHTEDLKCLFRCCKTGDINQLGELIDKGVSLNVRDRCDATPLYYACLCGHFQIVEKLLYSGAVCNADTFDAERCIHGALTLEIRDHLRSFQVAAKTVLKRSSYHDFLTKLRRNVSFTDATVTAHNGETIAYHRCIVDNAIDGKIFQIIANREDWDAEHIAGLLNFVYTAVLDASAITELDGLLTLTSIVGMDQLRTLLAEEIVQRRNLFEHYNKKYRGRSIIEGDMDKCMGRMVSLFSTLTEYDAGNPNYHDIKVVVNQERTYYCHKAIVCLRSPYIQSYIEFAATSNDHREVDLINIDSVKTKLFHEVMRFIYTDSISINESTNCFALLEAADMFLVPRMKHKVAKVLCEHITVENVVEMIQMARHFSVEALENEAVQFVSKHLEDVLFTEGFAQLVREDVDAVIGRQEVDSIDIIDALRFHLHTSSRDLALVDQLLESMGLIA